MAKWDDTQEGQDIRNAWESVKRMFNVWLPQHRQSLQNLAQRPFKG